MKSILNSLQVSCPVNTIFITNKHDMFVLGTISQHKHTAI